MEIKKCQNNFYINAGPLNLALLHLNINRIIGNNLTGQRIDNRIMIDRLLKAIPTGLLASGKEEPTGIASLTVTELTFLFGSVLGKVYNPHFPFNTLCFSNNYLFM